MAQIINDQGAVPRSGIDIDALWGFSHLEVVALPLVGVSAWQALVENIGLSKGQKILIHAVQEG